MDKGYTDRFKTKHVRVGDAVVGDVATQWLARWTPDQVFLGN